MGVDIGTQGTKSVIVSLDGRVLGLGLAEYGVEQPHPSWAEQWPQVWEEATYRAIKTSIVNANIDRNEIAAVCVSGLYGGSGIPVDKNFNPLRPCLIWMDRRATKQVKWIKKNIDLDLLFEITGNYVHTYFGYPKILWIKENEPKIWKYVYKFIPPSSYVEYKLTGNLAVDYSSAGNLGGIFDIHRLCWSEELGEKLGIPIEKMPEKLVPSAEIIGEITSEASNKTGLAMGTPVIAGGIDAPMATLSAGAIEPGDNVAMMGTSTCWGVIHRGEGFSKNLVSMPHVVNPSQEIYTWGGAATSGALARWFRDQFGTVEVETSKWLRLDPYVLLDLQAQNIPAGADGLVILPYFMGERAPLWDPDARGTAIGLSLYHTKAHVFRALLEAAGYSLRHSIEVGQEIGLRLKEETRAVGGVTKSQIWSKILADITGRKIIIPGSGVGAPLGDALLAGIGIGLIKNYTVVKEWLGKEKVVLPDPELTTIYSRYYILYRKFYEDIKEHLHELSAIGGKKNEGRK